MKIENHNQKSGRKLKEVVYVWNYLEWGGAQVYFLGLAARIMSRVPVRFVFPRATSPQFVGFCAERGIAFDFLDETADTRPAPTLKRKLQRHWRKFRSERSTLKFLKRADLGECVVHIEFSPWQSALALIGLCRRTSVFVTMHNALPTVGPLRRAIWKTKFAFITRFRNFHMFASNEDAKNSLARFVSRDFFDRVVVTYTNVNPSEIDQALAGDLDKESLIGRFSLPEDKILVFCLGQFIDRKGRWTFLEAAQKVTSERDDVAFVWISNSELSPDEQAKVDGYRLGKLFTLVKSEAVGTTHLELMRFLRIADVFTLPSFVEGLPISLLEAMALSIPSISTNVYAIPEAITDDQTGVLIAAGDSSALARSIIRLADDVRLRQRLGSAGRERVLSKFNEVTVAETAFKSYCDATAADSE